MTITTTALGVAALLLLQLTRHLHGVEAAECACATDSLHVRSGPGTDQPIAHTMTSGECLPYRGDSAQASGYVWHHLDYLGQDAWAASNWLRVSTCVDGGGGGGRSASDVQLPGCPPIVTRAEWGARQPAQHIGNMPDLPVYVFIHHGAGAECFDKTSCMLKVRQYQDFHIDGRGWSDIGYNFVVGEDGNAYEARGWTKIGAHTKGYNTNGIAISVIGDFTEHVPNAAALSTVRQLIQCGLDNHRISQSYTLKGHRDVGVTACPGDRYYHLIQSWPHYRNGTDLYVA